MALVEHLDKTTLATEYELGGDAARADGPDDAEEFHIAMSSESDERLSLALSSAHGPNASKPERGAICIITETRGRTRVTYNVREVLMPREAENEDETDNVVIDTTADFGFLTFSHEYLARARRRADELSGDSGLFIAHTHGSGVTPSTDDLKADKEDLYATAEQLGDVPLAAGIRSDVDGSWHIRAYEFNVAQTRTQQQNDNFGLDTSRMTEATAIRIVGDRLRKLKTSATTQKMGPAGVDGLANADLQDSSARLWHIGGQEKLAGLRIGVTGCGGVGSILTEWVARLGAGEAVLVDFDRFEPANFNRAQGASREATNNGRLKVEVAAELARKAASAENFAVRPVIGSVCEADRPSYDPLPDLLDCDIILNAADTHWAREVLDDIAYAHGLHVFDGGTILDTDEDDHLTGDARLNVALAGPNHPCLHCADMWTEDGLEEDMTHPSNRGYEDGDHEDGEETEERAPSVISMNGFVASLILQRFQAVVLGIAPEITTGALRYKPKTAKLRWRKDGTDHLTGCKQSCLRTERDQMMGDAFEFDRFEDPGLSVAISSGGLPPENKLETELSEPDEKKQSTKTRTEKGRSATTDETLYSKGTTIIRDIILWLL